MEDSKKRHSGTKVSKIANIFQGMPSKEEDEVRGSDVTGVRTESHLARFNNARALFEKLGEENRGFRIEKSPSAAASFAGTRGVTPPAPSRSRSSSAGSVSPPRRIVTPTPMPSPAVNGDRLSNGTLQPPPKPAKPSVLPKPDKPDRRFNKELIEKQRNWTAHFNKSRQSRSDETKVDPSKYSSSCQERKSPEIPERYVVPSRVYSPPLSPCAGDTQVERPTTLPSSLVNRVTPNVSPVKFSSPVKTTDTVSPLLRPHNNSVLQAPRTESLDSINLKSESFNSPQQTNDVDNTSQVADSVEKSHTSVRTSVSSSDENAIIESKEDSDLLLPKSNQQTPSPVSKPIEHFTTNPPSPASTPTTLEPVLTPRSQKSPSPLARTPKSPMLPLQHEIENTILAERESSVSSLHSEKSCNPLSENSTDSPTPQHGYAASLICKEPQELIKCHEKETNVCDPVFPSAMDVPLDDDYTNRPIKSLDEDDYKSKNYGGEWEEKNRRRSSTPESPTHPEKIEDMSRSPLVSPLASPVHHDVGSSPPPSLQASPAPGK